jgi:penicillin-binding protein 2
VAAIVENAGFGAAHAAPLVRRVMDYWLAGIYPSEADIAALQRGQAGAPIGTPRRVADMAQPVLAAP